MVDIDVDSCVSPVGIHLYQVCVAIRGAVILKSDILQSQRSVLYPEHAAGYHFVVGVGCSLCCFHFGIHAIIIFNNKF